MNKRKKFMKSKYKRIQSRYDYIIIWGHAIHKKMEILSLIENDKSLEIRRIIHKEKFSMKKFVRLVYSYDYAPIYHLKSKLRYLKKVPNEVIIVFVINNDPDEIITGDNEFTHLCSRRILNLKNEIRTKYNTYHNGVMSHNHVVHSSDNEMQTLQLISDLNLSSDLNSFYDFRLDLFGIPEWIGKRESYNIKKIKLNHIYANIIVNGQLKIMEIQNTPHFIALVTGNIDVYNDYLESNLGHKMTAYHSGVKFLNLLDSFVLSLRSEDLIVVSRFQEGYILQDGVHRAAIMKFMNYNEVVSIIL